MGFLFGVRETGVFLPDLCQAHRSNPRRSMAELLSSGGVAPGPIAGGEASKLEASAFAPAPAPVAF